LELETEKNIEQMKNLYIWNKLLIRD